MWTGWQQGSKCAPRLLALSVLRAAKPWARFFELDRACCVEVCITWPTHISSVQTGSMCTVPCLCVLPSSMPCGWTLRVDAKTCQHTMHPTQACIAQQQAVQTMLHHEQTPT